MPSEADNHPYDYIHIMPIGVVIEHVLTAINEPKFKPIKKIYLLHSPNDPKWKPKKCEKCGVKLFKDEKPLKDTAEDLKKRLVAGDALPDYAEVILREIDAFKMSSILNEISKIVREEHSDDPNPLNDIVVNVTGGTNMMAVASMWAAGANKISAYYILNSKLNPGLSTYLIEIETPRYKDMLKTNSEHKDILRVLKKRSFHWVGIAQAKGKENVEVHQSIRNSNWNVEETREGVTTLSNLIVEMKKKGVPAQTTRNRVTDMVERGLVTKDDYPKRSVRGGPEYPRIVYFIDGREKLISITDAGYSILI